MHLEFAERSDAPDRLICDAEIVFDDAGPLWKTKLVGFAIWEGHQGGLYVTFPSRPFGVGPERKYFDLLRSVDGDLANVKNVKSWILSGYERRARYRP